MEHRRRILAQKRCRREGSNTAGMVRRRMRKDGIGEESRKGNQPTGLHNILFKMSLNKNIVYKSRKHLKFK